MTKTENFKTKLKSAGKKVGEGMTRFAQYKWVQVIKDAALVQMPFMLIGSFFLITQAIAQMSIDDYANSELGRSMFNTIMGMGNGLSFGLASLITAFSLGFYASKITKPTKMKMTSINAGLLSMILFIILTCTVTWGGATTDANGVVHPGSYSWGFGTGFFNPKGFFTAIIAGVISHYIMYLFYMYRIGIRLPKEVPEFVTNAFNVVLTGLVVVLIGVGAVNLLALGDTSFNSVMSKIFKFLVAIGASWYGMYITMFFVMLAWFFGIHGGVTVQSIIAPTWLGALEQNQHGAQVIFAQGFKDFYVNAGGLACILILAIFMAFFAKSKKLKTIGKSSIVPGIFNISEPMVFGTPLIYNPYTIAPFFLIPMVNITIGGLFSMNGWFAAVPTIQVHWAIPAPIQAYLGTMSWQAAIVVVGIILIDGLCWWPFFKRYDKIVCAEEEQGKKTAATLAAEEKATALKQAKIKAKISKTGKEGSGSSNAKKVPVKTSSKEMTLKEKLAAAKKKG